MGREIEGMLMLPKGPWPTGSRSWNSVQRLHLSSLYLSSLPSFAGRFSLQSISKITQQIKTSFSPPVVTEQSESGLLELLWATRVRFIFPLGL